MRTCAQEGQILAAAGRGRHRVRAAAQLLGGDILLSVWGGSAPHIGSICIALPRPAGADPQRIGATSSVYNFPGHKDEAVARLCAERIAACCNRKTVAVAGIHIDRATPQDIGSIMENVEALCRGLIKKLGKVQ